MRVQLRKWGNSLAVRIPKSFALQAGLNEHAPVNLTLADGKLIIEPAAEPAFTLDELLATVNRENLHGEFETGPAAGQEAW